MFDIVCGELLIEIQTRSFSALGLKLKMLVANTPPPRSKVVLRPRLIERLNEGLRQKQGFGR